MKKTILIGALLFSSISGFASDTDRCKSSIKLLGVSANKSTEAYLNKDFKGACSYKQLANSFVEDALIYCPLELQAKLQEVYIQGKKAETVVCNLK
jgi:hypothetical protein